MRVSHYMTVNFKCGAGIGMAELPLYDFGVGSRVQQERSVSMAECVKAAPWYPECVENRSTSGIPRLCWTMAAGRFE